MHLLFPNIINLINNLTIHAKLDFAKGVSITKTIVKMVRRLIIVFYSTGCEIFQTKDLFH